ncbi:hypothetical protein SMICM17S_08700 [Streptomyces microflavus]
MVEQFGADVVKAYMGHVQDNTEESVRRIVARLHDGGFRYETDGGAVIQVTLTVDRDARSAVLDFTGTSPQQPGNFNAPRSVVTAAVLYVFRTLVGEDIPLNSGCLKPLDVRIPPVRCSTPPTRRQPSRAMWRPPRPSPGPCTGRSAARPRGPAP